MMTRNGRVPATLAILVVLLLAWPARGQTSDPETPAATAAEALLSRVEELAGRPLDRRFREHARRRLVRLATEELEQRRERAAARGLGGLNAPGDATRDLVYTPVAPCRVVDTRVLGTAGRLQPGIPRDVRITGIGLQGQGGAAGGCGIPVGLATAAELNFVAVAPSGPGNLRAWPYSTPPVGPPDASIINFALVPNLNLANGISVPLCDVTTTTCPFDLRVQADTSSTHLVIDVVGYFHRLDTQRILATSTASPRIASTIVPTTCTNLLEVAVATSGPGSVLVTTTAQFYLQHQAGSLDQILAHIAATPTGCTETFRIAFSDGSPGLAGYQTSSFTRSFDVPAAGTYTYYLNVVGSSTATDKLIENYQMFATFYPE